MTPEERVLEAYYERLTVFPVDKSRVISVEFQSADPELAAKVANTIADNYLTHAADRAPGADPRGRAAGSPARSTCMRKRVAEAEAKVEEFRSKTNLFIGTNNTSLSNQTLGRVEPRSRGGALAEGRPGVEGARDPRPAQARRPARVRRRDQFRADPPAQRAARHPARAARRAVVHAARQPSAHQGIEGADRRRSTARSATRRSGSRARSRTTRRSPARASSRSRAASTSSSSRRRRPTRQDVRAARAASATRSRSATCSNPISPSIARRPRATASARCRPMRASSRARWCRTRRISRRRCRSC